MWIGRILASAGFRQVAKVVLASMLAYLLALGERNDYALFGALGAAMVVGGSVGEDLGASLNRVRGTLAGTAVGIAIAMAMGTSIFSLGLAVAVVASASVGLGWGAPAMRVGIAMVLVVLFTHSSDAAHYALFRSFNTLLGVAVGLAVSRFVWPIRGRDEMRRAIDRSLAATAAMLDALAKDAREATLLPKQIEVLDSLAALRTAGKNASLEQRLHRDPELPVAHARLCGRAALAALGASIKLDELVQIGAPEECVRAMRETIVLLALATSDANASAAPTSELAARYEIVQRAAAAPEVQPEVRSLLVGLLVELQQIAVAEQALREAPRRDGSASSRAPQLRRDAIE